MNSLDCCFNFLNRSLPIFPKECIVLKPKDQTLIKVEAPFINEISGLAIIKIPDNNTQSTMILKLKFMQTSIMLDTSNNDIDTIIFGPEEVLGIIYLRSLGFYKIKQGLLQPNLSKYCRFKKADTLSEHFNRFINTLKKDNKRNQRKNIHGWILAMKECIMTDREILEKYIDLEKSYLTDKGKKEIMDMLYKYKEAFSLRDEIGTFPM